MIRGRARYDEPTPIYATLAAETHPRIAQALADAERLTKRATTVAEALRRYDAPNDPSEPPEGPVNVLDTIRTDFDNALTAHGAEIEAALATAAQVAASPAAQSVLAVVSAGHVPSSVLDDVARQLTNLDAEFAKLTGDEPAQPAA